MNVENGPPDIGDVVPELVIGLKPQHDLLDRVQYRGVIHAAEVGCDLRHGAGGEASGEVLGGLAIADEGHGTAVGEHIDDSQWLEWDIHIFPSELFGNPNGWIVYFLDAIILNDVADDFLG